MIFKENRSLNDAHRHLAQQGIEPGKKMLEQGSNYLPYQLFNNNFSELGKNAELPAALACSLNTPLSE